MSVKAIHAPGSFEPISNFRRRFRLVSCRGQSVKRSTECATVRICTQRKTTIRGSFSLPGNNSRANLAGKLEWHNSCV